MQLKEAHMNKIKVSQANARIDQAPRQRSVQKPVPNGGSRFTPKTSSESLNTNDRAPQTPAPLGHPGGVPRAHPRGTLSSEDGKNQRLYRVEPKEVDVLEALEQEQGPHDFWNRILGVNSQGRVNRLHKKIPSNRSRLRQFQKVRQIYCHVKLFLHKTHILFFQNGISFEPPARNPVLPRLKGQQAGTEASLLYHQKYVAAAATSISLALSTVKRVTDILKLPEENEDLDDLGLNEHQKMVKQLTQLRQTNESLVKILRDTALPAAAYGVKFLAKIFGDLTLSKLASKNYF